MVANPSSFGAIFVTFIFIRSVLRCAQRLVHSLLAEQLNSSNWKVRAVVCDVLGDVKGEINRDLVNKLKKVMWQDWSSEVIKPSVGRQFFELW